MKASVKAYIEDRFDIVKLLRKSYKGEVHLAQSRATGEFVIIKHVNLVGLPYKILRKNPNPIFAKIFVCAEDLNDVVVVEEFIPGEPLIERLQRENFLQEDDALKILIQLCDGLKFLHELGIIHRDIKPSNLILQTGGIVRLIDFDAARIVKENQSEDTNALGTKGYAPPEQYGYGQTDARSDIYSLGVTMQKLLGKNYRGRLTKILSKCTELDPKNRWQSVDELKAALTMPIERPNRKIFWKTSLVVAGLIFVLYNIFRATPTEILPVEEIPANQVEPPKIKIPDEVSAQNKKNSEEIFNFPEINLPPIDTPAPIDSAPLPKIEDTLPKIEPAPPPAVDYKTPQPFQKELAQGADYVKVEYFLDGERIQSWVDALDFDVKDAKPMDIYELRREVWGRWKISPNSAALQFPNSVIEVFVKNFSSNTLINPQLEIIFDNNGRVEKKILRGKNIAPGQTITFNVPLNNLRVDNPNYQLVNVVFDTITMNFRGDRAEVRGSNAQVGFHFMPD